MQITGATHRLSGRGRIITVNDKVAIKAHRRQRVVFVIQNGAKVNHRIQRQELHLRSLEEDGRAGFVFFVCACVEASFRRVNIACAPLGCA